MTTLYAQEHELSHDQDKYLTTDQLSLTDTVEQYVTTAVEHVLATYYPHNELIGVLVGLCTKQDTLTVDVALTKNRPALHTVTVSGIKAPHITAHDIAIAATNAVMRQCYTKTQC